MILAIGESLIVHGKAVKSQIRLCPKLGSASFGDNEVTFKLFYSLQFSIKITSVWQVEILPSLLFPPLKQLLL